MLPPSFYPDSLLLPSSFYTPLGRNLLLPLSLQARLSLASPVVQNQLRHYLRRLLLFHHPQPPQPQFQRIRWELQDGLCLSVRSKTRLGSRLKNLGVTVDPPNTKLR